MHFLLSSMSVVYVLTTPISEDGENATVDQIRRRNKWENDDYVCRGLILNGMYDPLFDIYQNVKSSKELCDSLEAKYMAEDASSKKFLISNFTNYKMTDSRPIMEYYNELLGILVSHLRIEESLRVQDSDKPKGNNFAGLSVVNIVEHNNSFMYNDNKGKRKHYDTKSDPNKNSKVTCWKCGKPGHLKKDCKGGKVVNKDDDVAWLNIVKDNISSAFMSTSKLNDSILWHARLGHVHFKRMQDMSKYELIPTFDMDSENDLYDLHATPLLGNKKYFVTFIDDASRITPYELWTKRKPNLNYLRVWGYKAIVRLSDPKLKTLGERGIECIFIGYAEHFKAFRFYVIELNESVSANSIIESRDVIFDGNRFSSVPRPSQRMDNPDITMEEYIRLEEEKAQKRGKVFNWETAKCGKIWYDEDIHDLRSVETEFLAMVFNDNLTSNETLSCEPTGKLVTKNGYDILDMAPLPPRKQRHPFLRYQGLEYSDQDIVNFEERLESIHDRGTQRVQVLDFEGMPELMRDVLYARMLIEHHDDDGVVVFTSQAWGRVFKTRVPLVRELILEFLSTLRFGEVLLDLDAPGTIQFRLGGAKRHPMLRLCHRMMAHSRAGRSQAPEKVTVTDLFYLRGLDVRSVNIPYLLARYLRRFAAGRKSGALISVGQFVARLAEHFGLLTEERFQGLTVTALEGDAGGVAEEAPVAQGGGNEDEVMPQAVPPPPRTQSERIT
ncbi:zinc finger, CCHC-type containing protein [Tanacetum coccineum]